jgi:hypothetical protein
MNPVLSLEPDFLICSVCQFPKWLERTPTDKINLSKAVHKLLPSSPILKNCYKKLLRKFAGNRISLHQ